MVKLPDKSLRDSILDSIVKECYWDYDIDRDNIIEILKSNNKREIGKLFSKIIYNSTDKLLMLSLFTQEQLQIAFREFKIGYNDRYITKHFLALKYLLLNQKVYIRELEWRKR
jgi:hypothetical protein